MDHRVTGLPGSHRWEGDLKGNKWKHPLNSPTVRCWEGTLERDLLLQEEPYLMSNSFQKAQEKNHQRTEIWQAFANTFEGDEAWTSQEGWAWFHEQVILELGC